MSLRLTCILWYFYPVYILCLTYINVKPDYVGENPTIPMVVNGTPAQYGNFPYQVGFRFRNRKSRVFCGGAIIRQDKILSAAHCFGKEVTLTLEESVIITRKELKKKYAVAGALSSVAAANEGQARDLKMVMYPSEYQFPFHSDIAIVFTAKPFIFNEWVNQIGYAKTFQDYEGTCLVSGYGRVDQKTVDFQLSNQLLYAPLTMMLNYKCTLALGRNTKHLICTDTISTNVGKGDSGGPLVCSNTGKKEENKYGLLVGIVSGSKIKNISFFTRVSSYARYIDKNTRAVFSSNPDGVVTRYMNQAERISLMHCYFILSVVLIFYVRIWNDSIV